MAILYKDVKIPAEMYFRIKDFIGLHPEYGFRSVSEFSIYASRKEMDLILDRDRK